MPFLKKMRALDPRLFSSSEDLVIALIKQYFNNSRAVLYSHDLVRDLHIISDDLTDIVQSLEDIYNVDVPQDKYYTAHTVRDLASLFKDAHIGIAANSKS